MIIANGVPKSGTHALMALLDTMGLRRAPGTMLACSAEQTPHIYGISSVTIDAARAMPNNVYMLAHVNASHNLTGFRVLTIFRDPRNVLVSYCRHRYRDGYLVTLSQALDDFWGAPFVEVYEGFLGWFDRSVIVRFENMPHAVIGDGAGIYDRSGQHWNTRTDCPSHWQDVWDQATEEAWIAHGGYELLAKAGYA